MADSFQISDTEQISVEFYDYEINQTTEYKIQIEIMKPFNSENEKLPAVILLEGDLTDANSVNTLKNELLINNYAVVYLNPDYSSTTLIELNSTLNYLLTREDIVHSQIGIMGHSHGAHYAFLFALMRSDNISSVVCANFWTFGKIYLDYFEYFTRFIDIEKEYDITSFFNNYTIQVSEGKPQNLFLISNLYRPQRKSSIYQFAGNLTLWEFEEFGTFYGNFENGTARQLNIEDSVFLHTSGLFDPNIIYQEIHWMNQGLGLDNNNNIISGIFLRISYLLFLIVIAGFCGILFTTKLLKELPYQGEYFKKIFKRVKAQRTGDYQEEDEADQILIETNPFESEQTFKGVFKLFLWLVIGINLILFAFYVLESQNLMYIWIPDSLRFFIDSILQFNEQITLTMYFGEYSFGIIYLWFMMVSLYQETNLDLEPVLFKNRIRNSNLLLKTLIMIEYTVIVWGFGYFFFFYWSGFNVGDYLLNIMLRLTIIYYLNSLIMEVYNNQLRENENKFLIYLKMVGATIILYFPIITIPELSYMFFLLEQYWFYYLPFIFIILISPVFFVKRVNLHVETFLVFYFLTLFHVKVFF